MVLWAVVAATSSIVIKRHNLIVTFSQNFSAVQRQVLGLKRVDLISDEYL